ncbi:Breast cancer 2, early onset [Dispira simplex]|nr:Breast cancer 2, early onset [Dispira simplex]
MDTPSSNLPSGNDHSTTCDKVDLDTLAQFGGFTTGRGKRTQPLSNEALRRAEQLLDLGSTTKETIAPCPVVPTTPSVDSNSTLSADLGLGTLTQFGGFATGKGAKINTPTATMLQQAELLLGTSRQTAKEEAAKPPPPTESPALPTGKQPEFLKRVTTDSSLWDDPDFGDQSLLQTLEEFGGFQSSGKSQTNGSSTIRNNKRPTSPTDGRVVKPRKEPPLSGPLPTLIRPMSPTPENTSSATSRLVSSGSIPPCPSPLANSAPLRRAYSQRQSKSILRPPAPQLHSPLVGKVMPSLVSRKRFISPFKSPCRLPTPSLISPRTTATEPTNSASFVSPLAVRKRGSTPGRTPQGIYSKLKPFRTPLREQGKPPGMRATDRLVNFITPTTDDVFTSTVSTRPDPPCKPSNTRLAPRPLPAKRWTMSKFRELCVRHRLWLQTVWPNYPPEFLQLSYHTAGEYTFPDAASLADSHMQGKRTVDYSAIRQTLLDRGCEDRVVTLPWVQNHYSLVVWKLASLARYFTALVCPERFHSPSVASVDHNGLAKSTHKDLSEAQDLLAVVCDWFQWETALQQLHARYEREFSEGRRSPLRKILELDDVPQRYLVLCLASVEVVPPPPDTPLNGKTTTAATVSPPVWLLTDGWYLVRAQVDPPLQDAYQSGKLRMGYKLATVGAYLTGAQDGHHPLEVPENVRLCLSANSTKRVPWDTKLGVHPLRPCIALRRIQPFGGVVTRVDVVVVKKLPVCFLETLPAGNNVVRNAKEEDKAQKLFMFADNYCYCFVMTQETRAQQANIVIARVKQQQEQEEQEKLRCHRIQAISKELVNGEDIYLAYRCDPDPAFFTRLSQEQQEAFDEYLRKKQMTDDQAIHEALSEEHMERKVRPFFKLIVTDYLATTTSRCGSGTGTTQALITLWGFGPQHYDGFHVGRRYVFTNLAPVQKPDLYFTSSVSAQLTSGHHTAWREVPIPVEAQTILSAGDFTVPPKTPPRTGQGKSGMVVEEPFTPPPYAFLAHGKGTKTFDGILPMAPRTAPISRTKPHQSGPKSPMQLLPRGITPIPNGRDSDAISAPAVAPATPVPKMARTITLEDCTTLKPGTMVSLVGIAIQLLPQMRQLTIKEPQIVVADSSDNVGVIQHRTPVKPKFQSHAGITIGCTNLTFQGQDPVHNLYLFTYDRCSTYVRQWCDSVLLKRYRLLESWKRKHGRSLRLVHSALEGMDGFLRPEHGYIPPVFGATPGPVKSRREPMHHKAPTDPVEEGYIRCVTWKPGEDGWPTLQDHVTVTLENGFTLSRLRLTVRQLACYFDALGTPSLLAEESVGLPFLHRLVQPPPLAQPLLPEAKEMGHRIWYHAWWKSRAEVLTQQWLLLQQPTQISAVESSSPPDIALVNLWMIVLRFSNPNTTLPMVDHSPSVLPSHTLPRMSALVSEALAEIPTKTVNPGDPGPIAESDALMCSALANHARRCYHRYLTESPWSHSMARPLTPQEILQHYGVLLVEELEMLQLEFHHTFSHHRFPTSQTKALHS